MPSLVLINTLPWGEIMISHLRSKPFVMSACLELTWHIHLNLNWLCMVKYQMGQRMTKPTKWHVRPMKTQISLGIRPVWSESLLCAQWIAKDPSFLHADSEDYDQTGWMSRLIWVFPGRTCHFVGVIMPLLKWHSFTKSVHKGFICKLKNCHK